MPAQTLSRHAHSLDPLLTTTLLSPSSLFPAPPTPPPHSLLPLHPSTTSSNSSELTCQNPKAEHGPEHEDGFIGFPIVSDRMKLVTVGVCEWTVTQVKEQRISEHAKLKGNTNVVW